MTAQRAEVVVVGGGPAGLAAALAAAAAGSPVLVIDAYERIGGQYFKQKPRAFGDDQTVFTRIESHELITVLSETTVWCAESGDDGRGVRLWCARGSESFAVDAQAVVIASGAFERTLPFPGWTLPGVMTAGAAQLLVKSQRVLPGSRIVVAGSGPFLFPVAAELIGAGARVVGVYEACSLARLATRMPGAFLANPSRAMQAARYLRTIRRAGVPIRYGVAVTRASGSDRVEHAHLSSLNERWEPVARSERIVEADTIAYGFGFMPATELAESLGCARSLPYFLAHDARMCSSIERVFVAGELTGIRGAEAGIAQGTVAGTFAAASTGRTNPTAQRHANTARAKFDRTALFAERMNDAYRIGEGWQNWLDDDTIVCRCERVSYRQVREALARDDVTDVRGVKSLTRCGMGHCQGRTCGYAVAALTAAQKQRTLEEVDIYHRHGVARPIPLKALASTCHPELVEGPAHSD